MRYTKQERIKALKEAIQIIKNGDEKSMCFAIRRSLRAKNMNWRKVLSHYPQILKYKPAKGWKLNNCFWFKPGVKAPRLRIMKAELKRLEGKKK